MKPLTLILVMCSALASAQPFPAEEWDIASPLNAGAWDEVRRFAFEAPAIRGSVTTNGLVVVHDGRIVAEGYANGYGESMRHLTWSVSKSVTGTLVGMAVHAGRLKLEDPAHIHYPALAEHGHKGVTIDHLMRMSSGLGWRETYEFIPIYSSVIKMLYREGRGDMAAFAASHKKAFEPGTHWSYSSGDTNILQAILRSVLKDDYREYPWRELFTPLGMRSVVWESDGNGTFVGSSYLHATPRDMARFGYLYLRNGEWAGKRLLPDGWATYVRTPAPAMESPSTKAEELEAQYGAQFWINTGVPARKIKPRWAKAPTDVGVAEGHWGQFIVYMPSHDTVVVRTGDDRLGEFDMEGLLTRVVAAAQPR